MTHKWPPSFFIKPNVFIPDINAAAFICLNNDKKHAMLKRALFCLSLFCSTLSYGQDASSVAAVSGLNPAQSIDRQSIVVAGPGVEFRLKSVYNQPQQLAHTQMYYQSAQYLIDANCSARTMTVRQGRYFSTYGAEVYSFNNAPAPSNLAQKAMGSIGHAAIDSICQQQIARKAI